MDSSEDIFYSFVNLEESHIKDGYNEGYADGLVFGKEESREVGLKISFEVGDELGYYRGCVDIWNSAIKVDPNCFSVRTQKNIKKMDALLLNYPILEPENKLVTDMIDLLRLNYKMISATLNMKSGDKGYPKACGGEKKMDF